MTNIEPIVPFRQGLIVQGEAAIMEPMVPHKKELTYTEFSERLHKACDHARVPLGRSRAKAVGSLVGVTYKGAGKWLSGGGMPDMGHATELAIELGVNFEWLMTGRGQMTGSNSTGGARSRHEEAWVDMLRRLPPNERKRFLATIGAVASAMGINTKKQG